MRDLKRYTSGEIRRFLTGKGDELAQRIFREAGLSQQPPLQWKVWQDEFHPVAIESDSVFRQKTEYVHANPVRKGLVELPEHWWYSSARAFLGEKGGPLAIDGPGFTDGTESKRC